MSKKHYGLLGCGMMGQEHLRNMVLLPDIEVSAIFEPDAGMRAPRHAGARAPAQYGAAARH
ncbi:MAG: hypothetical protein NTY26_14835 [Burkholderiales bacterium]|nr:hypothetical protein [Burkholderiales bacterium]